MLAQGIAWALMWRFGENIVQLPDDRWLLQGVLASMIGRLLGQPYWLAPIHLLLPLIVAYLAPVPATS